MDGIEFRSYLESDQSACLALFDANCPEFFAPNEREDYLRFLNATPAGYTVCAVPGGVVGAFGVFPQCSDVVSLNWILLDPGSQGMGIGSAIMARVLARARSQVAVSVQIAASHKSAPFFSRFGAVAESTIEHGWGAGMHRVNMQLKL